MFDAFKITTIILFFMASLAAGEVPIKVKPAMVFASGNTKFVLPDILERFYHKYPETRILIQYGATGNLADAIISGVHYDIFLAADMEYPNKVFLAKKSVTAPQVYAKGSLILFVPPDKELSSKGLNILSEKKINNITIANQETAPYGKASVDALKRSGLYKKLFHKIHYATNVATAITNVVWYDDAGFLSKSSVFALPVGYREEGVNWISVDPKLYEPIFQGYVVSQKGLKNNNAVKFLNFIRSKEGKAIFKAYGYE